MNRRLLLGGLFGLPFTQQLEKPRRELQKLKREPALKGTCPVCASTETVDVAEATTDRMEPRYSTITGTVSDSSWVTVIPAPKRLAACGQCGTCYLTKNPKAKE